MAVNGRDERSGSIRRQKPTLYATLEELHNGGIEHTRLSLSRGTYHQYAGSQLGGYSPPYHYMPPHRCGRGGIEPIRLSLGHNAERRHAGVQRMTVPLYILLGACCSANVVCL